MKDLRSNSPLTPTAEPLPGDVSPALRSLDSRLAIMAFSAGVPLGLADRVFDASRPMLANVAETQPRLRLVGSSAVARVVLPLHRQRWARLAMAASVLLACGAAIWMMERSPAVDPTADTMARAGHVAETVAFTLQPAHVCAGCHYEDNLAYLFETSSMTTAELTQDIAMLASRF
jgi:hypothetical protein